MLERIVHFLASAIGDFLSFVLFARFLMQYFRVSFASPAGEFVLALTNWLVKPLRRLLPGLLGLDWASLLPVWVIQSLLVALLYWLSPIAANVSVAAILVGGLVETVRIGIWVLIIALIASAVLSWVNPYSPFASPVMQLCRPILRPIQRVLPPVGRFDLSPLAAILLLNVALLVLDGVRGGIPRWLS
jgi:YggT family protein